jgi:hypothetical protein
MSTDSPRPPVDEVLASIRKKAGDVRDAANGLNKRIDEFEEILSALPGRTEAYHFGPHPDEDGTDPLNPRSLVIGLEHQGKGWQLVCGTFVQGYNDDPDNPVDYKPLIDAPLKFKLAAIEMFPDLLTAIANQQDKLVKKIQKASATYDQFAQSLKQVAKEGK